MGWRMFPYCSHMGVIRSHRERRLQQRARDLRRADTQAEARLWNALRDRRLGGWKWRRQVPVGPFIVDFLCVEAGLVVELDGGQHADRVAYDNRRTSYLEALGLRVIRYWNSHLLKHRDDVCLDILRHCGEPASPAACGPGEEQPGDQAGT